MSTMPDRMITFRTGVGTVSALTFFIGFFLTRREVANISTCANIPSLQGSIHVPKVLNNDIRKSCWRKHFSFSRVFLLIVDAMRLDFMTDESSFNYMHELLQHNSTQSTFFGFIADPPTVTSQRLKGLTTGSFPTFVDISSNFNSVAVTEDNLITQLLSQKKRLKF